MAYSPVSSAKRFKNLIVDVFVLFVLEFIMSQIFSLRGFGITSVMLVAYYFLFEFFLGKTPGKFYTCTKVVMFDGGNLSAQAIFIRSIVRLIPFEAFSLLSSKNPVGWHDKWSKTIVVEDNNI